MSKFIVYTLIICLTAGYGLGIHHMGYYYGTQHGQFLKLMEYYKVYEQCETKVVVNHKFDPNGSRYQFNNEYDASILHCLEREFK